MTLHRQHLYFKILSLLPGQLVIQTTDKCNALCPQCGMRATSKFDRKTLDFATIKTTIDAAARKGFKAVSFTGGEPFLIFDELCRFMTYAGEKKIPFIRTGSNGFWLKNPNAKTFHDRIHKIASKLAATPVRNFWISLDSSIPEIHEQMRGFKGVVDGMAKALPIFHDYGIYPSVNLGINRNISQETARLDENDFSSPQAYQKTVYTLYSKAFDDFYTLAENLGFTIANACYPMSIDLDSQSLTAVYQANTPDRIVRYALEEKKQVFKALRDTLLLHRPKIRIFTPVSALNSLINPLKPKTDPLSGPCLGGLRYFYMDAAEGNIFPCGFRGDENLGKLWDTNFKASEKEKFCKKCDWECFRDPSVLLSPMLAFFNQPISQMARLLNSPGVHKTWLEDLKYYKACHYFNGRKKPDYKKLSAYPSVKIKRLLEG